jgi:hypothetical protein
MKNTNLLTLLATIIFSPLGATEQVPDSFINALISVESSGDDKAVGDKGKAKGCLQIWEVVVIDVNRKFNTNYKHDDAFDRKKAIDICRKYLSIYATEARLGRKPTLEDYARIWNGGPNGFKKSATEKYWLKVQKALR